MSLDPFILNLPGRTLDCRPGHSHVMGILNVTPDSFSDGGAYLDPVHALDRAREMLSEGAELIDIGGASSRPKGKAYGGGAATVSPSEEAARVLPVVEGIRRELPDALISVDTFQGDVARQSLDAGAHLINDITALRHSPAIASHVARAGAGLALMHSVGFVGDMPHIGAHDDVVGEVASSLLGAMRLALDAGVRSLVLDPGFGFGKDVDDNFRLLNEVDRLVALGAPVLVGISRKSSIGAALSSKGNASEVPLDERLFGTMGATAVAVMRGATLVRTHYVAETAQMLQIMRRTRDRRL